MSPQPIRRPVRGRRRGQGSTERGGQSTPTSSGPVLPAETFDEAFARLYRAYGGAIYQRCRRLLRDAHEAHDLTHEVFARGLAHRQSLRPGPELLGWLHVVATRLCLNRLRDAGLARARNSTPSGATLSAPESAFADRDLVLRLLRDVDATTQALAVYVLVDGMTQDEAARLANVSVRTVRNRLSRFLAEAREVLSRETTPLPVKAGADGTRSRV